MRTKPSLADPAPRWRVPTQRARSMEVQLDGAVAYWLGDHEGRPLGPESGRALDPCLQALERINGGTDPETLALWARLANGGRYLVSNGLILHDLAEAAAGVTAPRRVRRG